MVVILERGQHLELEEDIDVPLHWYPAHKENGWPDWIIALCTCGNGHLATLSTQNHSVALDGTVRPSYVCPYTPCNFHEWVKLADWSPEA